MVYDVQQGKTLYSLMKIKLMFISEWQYQGQVSTVIRKAKVKITCTVALRGTPRPVHHRRTTTTWDLITLDINDLCLPLHTMDTVTTRTNSSRVEVG